VPDAPFVVAAAAAADDADVGAADVGVVGKDHSVLTPAEGNVPRVRS
jgi:hypothetical protein